jgi:hypothetical protein
MWDKSAIMPTTIIINRVYKYNQLYTCHNTREIFDDVCLCMLLHCHWVLRITEITLINRNNL